MIRDKFETNEIEPKRGQIMIAADLLARRWLTG